MKNIIDEADDLNERYITTEEDDVLDEDPWEDPLPYDEELEEELEEEEEDEEEALEELNFED